MPGSVYSGWQQPAAAGRHPSRSSPDYDWSGASQAGWDDRPDPGPSRGRVYGGGSPELDRGWPDPRRGGDRDTRLRERRNQRNALDRPARRPGHTPLWAKLTVTGGAVLMLFSGVALAGGQVLMNRYAENVQQDDLLGGAAVQTEIGEELTGPLNLLLLGIDAREPDSDDIRSDTIIVLHIPASHDQAYMISVPRDTWVTVPPFEPSGYPGGDAKITEAFYHGSQNDGGWRGGAQLVARTLHELTGLQFNGAAIINFSGFKKIIEEIGGVDFCVDTPASSEHLVLVEGAPMGIGKARREGHQYQPVRYEEGCQRLEAWQALDYARQRKTLESQEGDYGRQRHQQQLLKAMAKRATGKDVLTNPGKLDGLILAAGDALIVDTNNVPLVDFVFTLRDVGVGDMVSLRTNEGWFNSAEINGKSAEQLSPESLEMFRAAANDTMAQFVLNHEDFVNSQAPVPPATG